jgi:hypothetical protein
MFDFTRKLHCPKCGEVGTLKTEEYGMFHTITKCSNCDNSDIKNKTLPEEQPVLNIMNQQQYTPAPAPQYGQQPAQQQRYAPPAPAQQQEQVFAPGIRMFDKHPNAPDFVLASQVITLQEFFDFVNQNPQVLTDYNGQKQLKLQIKRSQSGAIYAAIDTYQKALAPAPAPAANGWGAAPAPAPAPQPAANGWGSQPAQSQAPAQLTADNLPF